MTLNTSTADEWYRSCFERASRYLDLDASTIVSSGSLAEVRVIGTKRRMPWMTVLGLVYASLTRSGCYPRVVKNSRGVFLMIRRANPARPRVLLWGILAVITIASVYYSGVGLSSSYPGRGLPSSPLGYLLGLLVPLLAHETGHWIVLRKYRTPASPPYLLPAPPIQAGFLGTFGAIINLRWLPPTEKALALSGIAGPLAGFLVAIPFALWGLKASIIVPSSVAREGAIPLVPLIYAVLPPPRPLGPHEVVVLSPMGFAAYIVFFVTFLNLIPVSTLDGGHIVRALLGYKGHKIMSNIAITLLILASIKWHMLVLFAAIALFFHLRTRQGHPGSAMGASEIGNPVMGLVGVIYVVLLLLTLPVPAR